MHIRQWKIRHWIVFGLVGLGALAGLVLIIVFAIVIPQLESRYAYVREMPIQAIDFSRIDDGTYEGDFAYGDFTYAVSAVVQNHTLIDARTIHNRTTRHATMAEEVLQRVIQNQSMEVDVITGATTTSKALLKALEEALNKGGL